MLQRRAELREVAAAEQVRLNEIIVVAEAESTVGGTRIADLAAACQGARRRVSAARGRLSRAQRDGNAEKIAAARAHLAAVDAECDRLSTAAITEMQEITRAQLDRIGAMTDQMGVTWDAQAAVTDTYGHPPVPRPGASGGSG
jgi:hypothetical protein